MGLSNIIAVNRSPQFPRVVALQPKTKRVMTEDTLTVSEATRQKINQLQQGNEALLQAVRQSRLAARNAALERVSYAKEYLKILVRMSPPGDRGAAIEAARMAREIKIATVEFRSSLSYEEAGASVRSEFASFAGLAGDTLNIARGLIESYLLKRKQEQKDDRSLEKEIVSAYAGLREMVASLWSPA